MQILTAFALLIPAFSLLYSPQPLTLLLHPIYNALLPIAFTMPKLRCRFLAPLNFRRKVTRPVSYYALFE